MLGQILDGLTNAATAENVIAAIARPEVLERIRVTANAKGASVGALVAAEVRHVVEHGGEAVWLDLIGVMSGSPQPGAAAIERMIAHAFPNPVRVRVTRTGE